MANFFGQCRFSCLKHLLNKLRMIYDTLTLSCIIIICSVFSLHTCQPPDKMFLDIGSNFPVCFSKMFLVLILTIIDDYKSLLFFVLFNTACYNDVSLHELPCRQKSHNDKPVFHKSQGILPFAVRMLRFVNRWLD